MPPQNVAEMLDNSNLDATWEKFVKYLTRFKFLAVGKIENLSLPQLKTIYNLNFKHNEVIFSLNYFVKLFDVFLCQNKMCHVWFALKKCNLTNFT